MANEFISYSFFSQQAIVFPMNGFIEFCDSQKGSPLYVMPDMKQPLLDSDSYRKWGALRQWNPEVGRLIKDNLLDDNEVEKFDAHNRDCIDAFKFSVYLLNRNESFPCSNCFLLSERIRILFGNDFYLLRFEDESIFNDKGKKERLPIKADGLYFFMSPPNGLFHLKRYHDLSSIGTGIPSIRKDAPLALFMPCVWEMEPQGGDGSNVHEKLQQMLEKLTCLSRTKKTDYEPLVQKAFALYNASQTLFSFYEKSKTHCIHGGCALVKRLWITLGSFYNSISMPSFITFAHNKQLYKNLNDKMTLEINIAMFFIRLLLCRYEEQSFREIEEMEKWFARHSPKKDGNGEPPEKNSVDTILPPSLFIASFDASVPDKFKDDIIRLFFRNTDDDIDDEGLSLRLSSSKTFCCSFFLKVKQSCHVLFRKDDTVVLPRINGYDCRIILGDTLYEKLKDSQNASSVIEPLIPGEDSFLWVVFDDQNGNQPKETSKKRSFIKMIVKKMPGMNARIWLLQRRKSRFLIQNLYSKYTSLLSTSQKDKPKMEMASQDQSSSGFVDSQSTTYINVYAFYKACWKFIEGEHDFDVIELKLVDPDINKIIKIRDIKDLALKVKTLLHVVESSELPEYYIRPSCPTSSRPKNWFMAFTQKHREHNLCILTVVFAFLEVFYRYGRVITEDKIKWFAHYLEKAHRRQKAKNFEKSGIHGKAKYQGEIDFFCQNLNGMLAKMYQMGHEVKFPK